MARYTPRAFTGIAAGLLTATLLGNVACSSSSSSDDSFEGTARLTGQAFRPVSSTDDPSPIPLANSKITLFVYAPDPSGTTRVLRTQDAGFTDEFGNYDVSVPEQPIVAVAVEGEVEGQGYRSAGLIYASRSNISKNFASVTDVACEALVTRLESGEVDPNSVNQRTIDNLEEAAEDVVALVDFTDPTSVSAAADLVAARTNNGQFAPDEVPEEDIALECEAAEALCNDGTPVCSELLCNGIIDCPDSSDESEAVCLAPPA